MLSWDSFKNHGSSYNNAFEAMCIQLFDRWVGREYVGRINYCTPVNDAGGDGGVECYAELIDSTYVGLQAKWFRERLEDSQFSQIEKSIISAMTVRPALTKYIVCVPRLFGNAKIGRGGKVTKTNEFEDIENFKERIKQVYTNLELFFWTEKEIIEELQKSENDGILRYWFEKSELSFDQIKNLFDRVEKGWLSERYIPELHHLGLIEKEIEKVLLPIAFRKEILSNLDSVIGILSRCIYAIEKFVSNKIIPEFDESLIEIESNFSKYKQAFEKIVSAISNGELRYNFEKIIEVDIWKTKLALEKISLEENNSTQRNQLIRLLEKAHQVYFNQYLNDISNDIRFHNAVILGKANAGKTHAVASAVKNSLRAGMPALIIQAKSSPADSWAHIMQHVIDGLNDWTGDEIFSALEALAYLKDVETISAPLIQNELPPHTKLLICVDGVEENVSKRDEWKDRINELRDVVNKFPRLKFVVTCRVFPSNSNPLNLTFDDINKEFWLPNLDVPIHEYIDQYLEKYQINLSGFQHIKSAIKDGLMLRLFCEQYAGKQNFADIQVAPTINKLLFSKVDRLENEFYLKHSPDWQREKSIQVFFSALAEIFSKSPEVNERELIFELENNRRITSLITKQWFGRLLDYFSEHGIITIDEISGKGIFDPPENVYSITYQSYLEFALSLIAVENVIRNKDLNFPKSLNGYWNAMEFASITLLTDYNMMVGENGLWQDFPISELKLATLVRAPLGILEGNKKWLTDFFKSSVKNSYQVIDSFILPNCRNQEFPIRVSFIHEILNGFKSTYDRDLIWSGPEYFSADDHFRISNLLKDEKLNEQDIWDELPLLLAWSLTSIDIEYRESCKIKLAKWGYENIEGFVKILDSLFYQGDPQLQEDLSQISVGISSLIYQEDKHFSLIANWFLREVFAEEKIQIHKNAVVRNCGRIVCERALFFQMISVDDVKKSRPPYSVGFEILTLDKYAINNSREEIYPIVHDLAWYVIKDSYRGFLDYGRQESEPEPSKFFHDYYKATGVEGFGPYEFAMSAAIHYIKLLGFTRNEDDGNSMTAESHGSISKVATLEEKYTWLAVHFLQGYLADCIPLKEDYGNYREYVKDYNKIISIDNPAQSIPKNFFVKTKNRFLVKTSQSPKLMNPEVPTEGDIATWLKSECVPNFGKILQYTSNEIRSVIKTKEEGWIAISSITHTKQRNGWVRSFLEATAGLILSSDFKTFQENEFDSYEFEEPSRFHSSPGNGVVTYINSKLIIQHFWIDEDYSELKIEMDKSPITLYKSVLECSDKTMKKGEHHYRFPSKLLRRILGITDGDGVTFYNSEGDLVAFKSEVEESYDSYQEILFVNENLLKEKLKANGLEIFWLVRHMQFPTTKATEKFESIYAERIRRWLVWKDGNMFNSKSYFDNIDNNLAR